MLTYTTVGWIIIGLLVYAVCIVAGFCALSSSGLPEWETDAEQSTREEKERVADRMREGRY